VAAHWDNDTGLFALARELLFTAVVGDIMDKIGLQDQFLPPQIRAMSPDMVVIGRAMPVLESDWIGGDDSAFNPALAKPFGLMLDALDSLQPNEVYICTGASPRYALWGELMTARARVLGAAGVVLDGYLRDVTGILAQKFPAFAYGSYAQDQAPRGKVIDYRTSIQIANVKIAPGDIVFGDVDGVCIVPKAAEEDVFVKAIEKARGEKHVRNAIDAGMSAREAFEKFGIL
jgi:regulator of RNase E activity RraA